MACPQNKLLCLSAVPGTRRLLPRLQGLLLPFIPCSLTGSLLPAHTHCHPLSCKVVLQPEHSLVLPMPPSSLSLFSGCVSLSRPILSFLLRDTFTTPTARLARGSTEFAVFFCPRSCFLLLSPFRAAGFNHIRIPQRLTCVYVPQRHVLFSQQP